MFTNISITALVLLPFFTPALSICPRLEEYRRLWTLGEVQAYNQDQTCSICLFITNETIVYAFSKPNSTTACDSDSFCVGSAHNNRWGHFWPVFVPDAWGPRNSQHLADPFTLTHLHHGTLWFMVTSLLSVQERHFSYAFVVLALLEGIWEYEENSDLHDSTISIWRTLARVPWRRHTEFHWRLVGGYYRVYNCAGGCRKHIPSHGLVEQPFGPFCFRKEYSFSINTIAWSWSGYSSCAIQNGLYNFKRRKRGHAFCLLLRAQSMCRRHRAEQKRILVISKKRTKTTCTLQRAHCMVAYPSKPEAIYLASYIFHLDVFFCDFVLSHPALFLDRSYPSYLKRQPSP